MDTLQQSISFLLNYTTRNMRRYAADRLVRENAGITVDQWGVLAILHENKRGLSNAELATRMLKDRPTVTRIVDILVREKLVERLADMKDRRRLRLRLTADGKKKIKAISPLVQQIRGELAGGMSAKDRTELIRILSKMNSTIDGLRRSRPE